MTGRGTTAAIIPAKDEAERIMATVTATWRIPGVDVVVVVDDGSRDSTSDLARRAGAQVVRHERNRGKGAAMATGAAYVARLESSGRAPGSGAGSGPPRGRAPGPGGGSGSPRGPSTGPGAGSWSRHLLFVDADLEDSASGLGVLIGPVVSGDADMTIAILPPQRATGGGRGLVVDLARRGVEELTGWTPTQPLSGMRCLTRAAFGAAQPLARGWGVETGLTIDVLAAGLEVVEVPCALQHRVTGRDWRAQLHRGRQYRDVALALSVRRARRRAPRRARRRADLPATPTAAPRLGTRARRRADLPATPTAAPRLGTRARRTGRTAGSARQKAIKAGQNAAVWRALASWAVRAWRQAKPAGRCRRQRPQSGAGGPGR